MKYLTLVLLALVGCANRRPVASMDEAQARFGNPRACEQIVDHRYCKWDGDILVFDKSAFVKTVAPGAELATYTVTVDSKIKNSLIGRSVALEKASGISEEAWKKNLPFLKGMLSKNRIKVDERGQRLVVNFALSKETRRPFLTFKSNDLELKVSADSISTQIDPVLPVLVASIEADAFRGVDHSTEHKMKNNGVKVESLIDYSTNYLK
jgi:hypothetical protein